MVAPGPVTFRRTGVRPALNRGPPPQDATRWESSISAPANHLEEKSPRSARSGAWKVLIPASGRLVAAFHPSETRQAMIKTAFEYAGNLVTVLRQSALRWDSPRARINARLHKFCSAGGTHRRKTLRF